MIIAILDETVQKDWTHRWINGLIVKLLKVKVWLVEVLCAFTFVDFRKRKIRLTLFEMGKEKRGLL